MIKYLLFITVSFTLLLVKIQAIGQTPDWLWANSAGGSNNDYSNSITSDNNGDVFITGSFESQSITFGSTTLINIGYSDIFNFNDIFIVKYNSSGNVLWAKSFGGISNDISYSIENDKSGNVYVTGFFSDTITFDSFTLISAGNNDLFVVKFDNNGNVLWARSAGGVYSDVGNQITIDESGEIYVTGPFRSSSITFGTTTLTNNGLNDIFIVKYDNSGNVLWAKSAGGNGYDGGLTISTDSSKNVYVAGNFQSSSITFDSTTLINNGLYDIFIVKYDKNGNVLWARSAGNENGDNCTNIVTDVNGNIYATGGFYNSSITFGSTTLTNSGNNDIFIVKYDNSGGVIWAKSIGGNYDEVGRSIATDLNGDIYIIGSYTNTITFGSTTLINTNNGYYDIFLAKYDNNGNVLWAKSVGGLTWDVPCDIHFNGVGNIYVTGSFYSPSILFGSTTLTNAGPSDSSDIFIAKLDGVLSKTEEILTFKIDLLPNPFSTHTIIQTNFLMNNATLSIYNNLGEAVKQIKNISGNIFDLHRDNLPGGIYFIQLCERNKIIATKKIILKD